VLGNILDPGNYHRRPFRGPACCYFKILFLRAHGTWISHLGKDIATIYQPLQHSNPYVKGGYNVQRGLCHGRPSCINDVRNRQFLAHPSYLGFRSQSLCNSGPLWFRSFNMLSPSRRVSSVCLIYMKNNRLSAFRTISVRVGIE
jgi:hypothetical protein